jgi:hypothetical protein
VQSRGDADADFIISLRTSDAQISEVLIGALCVVTRTSSSFVLAHWFIGVDLMAECRRHEAASNVMRKVRMVAVRLEHSKGTLVRGELDHFYFLVRGVYLFRVSYACRRVEDVQIPMQFWAAALGLNSQQH